MREPPSYASYNIVVGSGDPTSEIGVTPTDNGIDMT
jgi:hypothetical protein